MILAQSAVDFISTLIGEVATHSSGPALTVNVSQMQVEAKARRTNEATFFRFKAGLNIPTA
jgi:hypothetical protein